MYIMRGEEEDSHIHTHSKHTDDHSERNGKSMECEEAEGKKNGNSVVSSFCSSRQLLHACIIKHSTVDYPLNEHQMFPTYERCEAHETTESEDKSRCEYYVRFLWASFVVVAFIVLHDVICAPMYV